MRPRNYPRITSLLMSLVAVFGLAVAPVMADSAQPRVITLTPRLSGARYPRLVELTDRTAAVLWTGEDHVTWAQRVDPGKGLLAATARVGQLTSGGDRLASDPVPVVMPDGDLALVGLLADGRIAFARGSSSSDRRVAARLILPASPLSVVGLAAASTGDGLAVLVLRSAHGTELKGTMEVSLYAFDSRGAEARPAMTWRTAAGKAARLAHCAGTTFFAWETSRGVVTGHLSADGKRSRETPIGGARGDVSSLGPMICVGNEARLLTGWRRSDVAQAASVGVAGPNDTKPRWQTVALPGAPESTLTGDPMLAAYPADGSVQLVLNGHRAVTLDLATLTVAPRMLGLAAGSCMPSSRGDRALCGSSKAEPAAPGCRSSQAQLQISFIGAEKPADIAAADGFWQRGEIERVDSPSSAALAQQADLLRCGQDPWSALRDALAQWCARQSAAEADAYCSKEVPTSILYQAVHCSDEPLGCAVSPRAVVPSVRRAQLAAGRVEMKYGACSVWLVGKENSWRVDNADCGGD